MKFFSTSLPQYNSKYGQPVCLTIHQSLSE